MHVDWVDSLPRKNARAYESKIFRSCVFLRSLWLSLHRASKFRQPMTKRSYRRQTTAIDAGSFAVPISVGLSDDGASLSREHSLVGASVPIDWVVSTTGLFCSSLFRFESVHQIRSKTELP